MRVVTILTILAVLCVGFAAATDSSSSVGLRRKAQEGEEGPQEEDLPTGFFANVWNHYINGDEWNWKPFGETNWKRGDDHNISELGAYVFEMTFDGPQPLDETTFNADAVHLKSISPNGATGDKWNRYMWSSALDEEENLWLGTFNANINFWNVTLMSLAVARAPWGMKRKAMVDFFLRYFHGGPIMESAGGQILRRNAVTGAYDVMFQAPAEFVGFRSMAQHNGNIYAGTANGPDHPTGLERYDFSWYDPENIAEVGAKVFTNAGGEWHMLDDQGNLDGTDKSIRKMCVSSYSNRLFVGTETHKCAKVLIYDESVNSWKKIQQTGDDCKLAVSECLDIGNGKMLIGTWQSLGSALYVIDELNGDAITKVDTPPLWAHFSCGVMELNVFKDQLYVGLLSFPRGFALMRTSNLNVLEVQRGEWELITTNGFAQEQREQLGARVSGNEYPWSSAVVNGVYVIGTMTITQRGISTKSIEMIGTQPQLWASRDGSAWTLVHHGDQPGFLFGYRTMQVTSDQRLFIGSASNIFTAVDRETALETVTAGPPPP